MGYLYSYVEYKSRISFCLRLLHVIRALLNRPRTRYISLFKRTLGPRSHACNAYLSLLKKEASTQLTFFGEACQA